MVRQLVLGFLQKFEINTAFCPAYAVHTRAGILSVHPFSFYATKQF